MKLAYEIVEEVAAAFIHHCEAGWHHELTDLAFPHCSGPDEYALNLDHVEGLLTDLASATADWRERSL